MSVLTVKDITKVFPGTTALDRVSLSFESGKVNALIGKNGSGKSTLVKIINGAYRPDEGSLELDGKALDIQDPADAFSKGIATVYQEMSLIPGLTVAENILIGRYETHGSFVDWKATYAKAQSLLDEMGIDLPIREQVVNLNVWQCQVVEIVKAMSFRPKVILLDEPTSALAQHETQILFRLIRELKKKGRDHHLYHPPPPGALGDSRYLHGAAGWPPHGPGRHGGSQARRHPQAHVRRCRGQVPPRRPCHQR